MRVVALRRAARLAQARGARRGGTHEYTCINVQ